MRRKNGNLRRRNKKMEAALSRQMEVQIGKVTLAPFQLPRPCFTSSSSSASSCLDHLESEISVPETSRSFPSSSACGAADYDSIVDDKDFILSQDFFCTPDYITPDNQHLFNNLDLNKDDIPCPKSPEKLNTVKSKRRRQGSVLVNPLSPTLYGHQQVVELGNETYGGDELKSEKIVTGEKKIQNYVSQSAVALRCRVMPPPCMKNPYLRDASEIGVDPFGNQRTKCAGFFPSLVGGDSLSRYYNDFQEIEHIGTGNFSRVFKALKRIDGCLYAVKHSARKLHQEMERRRALMEVQALGAIGFHENIVGYYSSWFENEQLYIQMELCDCSLSINKASQSISEGEVLRVLHQIAKALQIIHEKGIAHLDVKPDNIYVKNGIYKLGDFGCATLLDKSLPIEEGDARYMPHEILNDRYDYLDKVDIFSLGAAIFELIRGSALPESGPHLMNLKEGKLPLLPGHSLQFQNLLKVMLDLDPVRRPSAKDIVENLIFDKLGASGTKR